MRSVPEWIAKRDDEAIPPRVKLRVFDRCKERCAVCTLEIRGKLTPEYDHIVALINGGQHRESNLQVLCSECHKDKTRQDVAEKSETYGRRLKAVGIKARSGRPMPGSRASKFKRKMDGSVVLR